MSCVNGLYGLELSVMKYETDTRPIEVIMAELYDDICKDINDDDADDYSPQFPYCYYYNKQLFELHARFLLEECRDIGKATKQEELMTDINDLIEEINNAIYDMREKEDDNIFMFNHIDNMFKQLECAY